MNEEAQLLTQWLSHLNAWRETLCDELLEIKSPIRDRRLQGLSINLTLSIRTIDSGSKAFEGSGFLLETLRLGQLVRQDGFVDKPISQENPFGKLLWYGSIPEVEKRIKVLTNPKVEVIKSESVSMNEERDAEICQMYVAGQLIKEIADAHKLTTQRVLQILRHNQLTRKDRIKKKVRDEFLGVNLSEPVKKALRKEALRQGISMSQLTADWIEDAVKRVGAAANG